MTYVKELTMTFRSLLLTLSLTICIYPAAHANDNKTWADISDVGLALTIGAAVATPTLRGDWQGLGQAALSGFVASGISQGLKATIHEQRPDHSDDKSFPSGHTTVAFASATTLHRRYGWKFGFPAYGVAALTGVARVAARKHQWWDVAAGATLGTASGWFFTDAFNDKVQLTPWVDGKNGGVLVGGSW